MPSGRCLCGAVRFEVTGALTEIELCHCAKCKRAFGSAFAATLYTRSEDFHWTDGQELVVTWDAPLEESPPAYRHCFCRTCGTPLPVAWDGFPLVELPAACLDDAGDARPAYHMFVTQKAAWHEIADGLPQHPRGGPLESKVLMPLLKPGRGTP